MPSEAPEFTLFEAEVVRVYPTSRTASVRASDIGTVTLKLADELPLPLPGDKVMCNLPDKYSPIDGAIICATNARHSRALTAPRHGHLINATGTPLFTG